MTPVFNLQFLFKSLLALLISVSALPISAADNRKALDELKNGNLVALMRHAIAPGNGDPAEFTLGDCNTQRNLSNDGLLQAKRIGLQFKDVGIARADVYSSQWCRCVDTAVNLDLGSIQELPLLNSFYQDRSTADTQTEQLRAWILNRLGSEAAKPETQKAVPAILVTHQVNITALTGVFPGSGEVVFIAIDDGQLTVVPLTLD